MAAEIWLHGFPLPHRTVDLAVQAERWGFDGLLLADSENLVGDPYVELALASRSTERLRLGPGVTNPLTAVRPSPLQPWPRSRSSPKGEPRSSSAVGTRPSSSSARNLRRPPS
jgi:hypothetical protein